MIRREMGYLARELAEALAFEEAISLAYKERTGMELQEGGVYLDDDIERAEEILRLYPGKERIMDSALPRSGRAARLGTRRIRRCEQPVSPISRHPGTYGTNNTGVLQWISN
jgi:hypothetical protein